MTMRTYRAAVVQTLARLGDLDENIRLLRAYTAEAVRQGAKLVVFPECMNTGYLFDSPGHCRSLAEPLGEFAYRTGDERLGPAARCVSGQRLHRARR